MTADLPERGRGFGISPEVAAEGRALRIRIDSAEQRPRLVIIDARYSHFLSLPFLDERRVGESWVPKYDRLTGEVYTTRWDDPTRVDRTDEKQERRFVPEPGNSRYIQLVKPGWVRGEANLANISSRWDVQRLIPQKHQDIESALRQQDEVDHDYGVDGPEYTRVRDTNAAIKVVTNRFIKGRLSNDDMLELQEGVSEVLRANGLTEPDNQIWQKIADKVSRAVQRDSLMRINPGRGRWLLASAYVDAVRREVGLRLAGEKSGQVYLLLLQEREIERGNLEVSKDMLDSVAGLNGYKSRDTIFDHEVPQQIADSQISAFRGRLGKISVSLKRIRVNPYLTVARISDLLLTSNDLKRSKEMKDINRTLTDTGMESLVEVAENGSVEKLIMLRDPFNARRMLRSIRGLIQSCLQDGRLHDIKVF
jgi:hypothetical protein